MLALASPFRASIVCVVLASVLVTADPGSHGHDVGRRHHAVNLTERDGHIEKRFDNTRFTYFYTGVNACGGFDHDSDFIVALNTHQWDGGSHCFEEITVSYNGKSANAKITDMCVECPYAAIDLSPGLFNHLVPGGTHQGQVYGEWNFGAAEEPKPAPLPEPKTTTKKHSTTTTKEKPTTTSTSTKTSTKPTTTSSSTSSSSSSTTSSASTSAPAATVTSFDTGNINQFNMALLQMADMMFASPTDA